MAKIRRACLGIEFHPGELRVVELRKSGLAPAVAAAHTQSMPPAAIQGGVVKRPDLVAETINKALERMGATTRAAVLGLPAPAVTMRVLDVPPVPEAELPFVVEGELKHFEILREQGGTFDFLPLRKPAQDSSETQVLLMAVEESIIAAYRDAAARANLQVDAIEPLHMAMFRSASPMVRTLPSVMFVAISDACSEIGFLIGNEFCLYRRVDIGAEALANLTSIDEDAANAMGTEIKRSLDYFHRQFPSAPGVSRIVISTNEPSASGIGDWLANHLKMDVEMASSAPAAAITPAVAGLLDPPQGLAYYGAIGLALRGLNAVQGVPDFDLTYTSGSSFESIAAKKQLTGALVASACIALLFGGLATYFGIRLGQQNRTLDEKKVRLANLNMELGSSDQIVRLSMLRNLSKEGVPFPKIMDQIATALDPNAGLVQVTLAPDFKLRITGEATSEVALINTMERLRMTPFFANTLIDSFDKNAAEGRGIRFDISSQYVPEAVAPVAPPTGAQGNPPAGGSQ